MGVEDALGEGIVDRPRRAPSRTRPSPPRRCRPRRARRSAAACSPSRSKEGPKPPKAAPVDQDRRDAGARGATSRARHGGRATTSTTGKVGGEDRLEDGAAARGQHPMPHRRDRCVGAGREWAHVGTLPAAFGSRGPPRRSARPTVRTRDRAQRPGRRSPTGLPPVRALRRSVPLPRECPSQHGVSAPSDRFPKRNFQGSRGGAVPTVGPHRTSAGAPRRSRSSEASSRSQNPQRGESSVAGSGTTTTRMRAALAAMAPLKESSTARQDGGSTPSLAAVVR